MRALVGLGNGGQQLFIGRHAHQQIDLGNLGAQLLAVALHKAARDDQHTALSTLFVLGHLENRVDRFLLGGEYEAAGVDDDDLGLARIGDNGVARLAEHTQHDFAVHAVFRAAQGHQTNGFHVACIVLPYKSLSPRRDAEKSAFRLIAEKPAAAGTACAMLSAMGQCGILIDAFAQRVKRAFRHSSSIGRCGIAHCMAFTKRANRTFRYPRGNVLLPTVEQCDIAHCMEVLNAPSGYFTTRLTVEQCGIAHYMALTQRVKRAFRHSSSIERCGIAHCMAFTKRTNRYFATRAATSCCLRWRSVALRQRMVITQCDEPSPARKWSSAHRMAFAQRIKRAFRPSSSECGSSHCFLLTRPHGRASVQRFACVIRHCRRARYTPRASL